MPQLEEGSHKHTHPVQNVDSFPYELYMDNAHKPSAAKVCVEVVSGCVCVSAAMCVLGPRECTWELGKGVEKMS